MADLFTSGWKNYELIDSGNGRKLERFGHYVVDRPEPQAMWIPKLDKNVWDNADAVFTGDKGKEDSDDGRWQFKGSQHIDTWKTSYGDVNFYGRFTPFRHMGFFPEQSVHWDWMVEKIQSQKEPRLLNLFGYTGVASLVAAKAGAHVTHVDASKKAIKWARENQELSGGEDLPIRWICEDARKFVAREVRRGNTYTGILLDPPRFGRGTKYEVWELFDDLPEMLKLCRDVLDPKGGFVILTSYAIRASYWAFHELCDEVFSAADVKLTSGELVIEGENGGRKISTSMYCRIERGDK